MKKILVIGSSGAGKSTFSRRMSEKTNIEILHLDKLYWKPNWTEPSKEEWKATLEKAMRGESWIMDGNYSNTLDLRLPVCDTAIFLDMPRAVCVYRVLKRVALSYGKVRLDMAENCVERFDWSFVKWVWDFKNRSKPKIERLLKQFKNEKTIIHLKSKRAAERFLANCSENFVLK